MSETITTFTTNQEIRSKTPEDIGAFQGPQPILKMFHIYHSMNKKYMFSEHEHQPREYIGYVMAKDIDDAFVKSQNDFGEEYREYKKRSTSVGDLIQDDYGFYMVCNIGFKLICLVDDSQE